MQFRVIERQTIRVAYYVEADNEAQARDHVASLGANEYDDLLSVEKTKIIHIELTKDETRA